MEDLLKYLLNKWGIKSIIYVILITLIIWGLAHLAAAPGEKISVLWGLVEYTKSCSENCIQTTDSESKTTELKTDNNQKQRILNNVPSENVNQKTEGEKSPAVITNGNVSIDYSD